MSEYVDRRKQHIDSFILCERNKSHILYGTIYESGPSSIHPNSSVSKCGRCDNNIIRATMDDGTNQSIWINGYSLEIIKIISMTTDENGSQTYVHTYSNSIALDDLRNQSQNGDASE